jgi:N-acetyltransferase
MNPFVESVVLRGAHATLHPLAQQHAVDLRAAVRSGDLSKLWYTAIPTEERVEAEIDRRLALLAAGSMLPFAVEHNSSGSVVGMTSYMNIDATNRRVEIGSTWYSPSVQRTGVNTECKLMLLRHAFETLGCIAVEFRTHFFNHQSRAGIERLGAKLDGVLRSHQLMPNGTLRDTAVYSIVATEWPTVAAHLRWQLDKPRGA